MLSLQDLQNFFMRSRTIKERQQMRINLSMEQCIGRFRNQENLPVVYCMKPEMRSELRLFNQASIRNRLSKDSGSSWHRLKINEYGPSLDPNAFRKKQFARVDSCRIEKRPRNSGDSNATFATFDHHRDRANPFEQPPNWHSST